MSDTAASPDASRPTTQELLNMFVRWRDQDHTLHERVEFLEMLSATTLELDTEESTLTDNVRSLGVTAGALAKALDTVDRNQTTLMNLANDVDQVKKTTPTKGEVKSQVKQLADEGRRERLRLRGMVFSAIVIAVGLVGATCFGVYAYDHARQAADVRFDKVNQSICQQRSTQANLVQDFIKVQRHRVSISRLLTTAEKTEASKQYSGLLKAFPNVDCNHLKTH